MKGIPVSRSHRGKRKYKWVGYTWIPNKLGKVFRCFRITLIGCFLKSFVFISSEQLKTS